MGFAMGIAAPLLKDVAASFKVEDDFDGVLQDFQKFMERHPRPSVDTQNMLKLLPAILELQAQKAAVYGRSYCRHGDLSIFLNTERKWDRISNIMEKAMKNGTESLYQTGTPTETFVDTVVDLASYGLLWVGYIMENHPEVFQKFLESNGLISFIQPESPSNEILPTGLVDNSEDK